MLWYTPAAHRLGQIEAHRILVLAGVVGAKELLQAHDVRPAARRIADRIEGALEIARRIGFGGLLDEPYRDAPALQGDHAFPRHVA